MGPAYVNETRDSSQESTHCNNSRSLNMKTIEAQNQEKQERNELHIALAAPGRSTEIPESCDIYGWLIGSWELDVLHYRVDVRERHLKGEVHFARVLEGRAVQDVWIMPPRAERSGPPDRTCNMYGTTLRLWDPALQAWRITWINGVTGTRDELITHPGSWWSICASRSGISSSSPAPPSTNLLNSQKGIGRRRPLPRMKRRGRRVSTPFAPA